MGGGGVRDILSHLIEYIGMTENTNEKTEPREITGKRFRSSGRKVPSFSPLSPPPTTLTGVNIKKKWKNEELEDIEKEREFLFFSSGGLFFLKPPLLFVAQGRGGRLMARKKDVVPPKVGKRGFWAACCCCNVR